MAGTTIEIDQEYIKKLIYNSSKLIELEGKVYELARDIDRMHSLAVRDLDLLKDKADPSHMNNLLHQRLQIIEYIAKNIENLFQITVLTSPRD